uniref:Uncharacterized protein n=1 Tax=Cacopsylla melanoneura TaxID=428564 RepID=A0A8D8T687_9HEMI
MKEAHFWESRAWNPFTTEDMKEAHFPHSEKNHPEFLGPQALKVNLGKSPNHGLEKNHPSTFWKKQPHNFQQLLLDFQIKLPDEICWMVKNTIGNLYNASLLLYRNTQPFYFIHPIFWLSHAPNYPNSVDKPTVLQCVCSKYI